MQLTTLIMGDSYPVEKNESRLESLSFENQYKLFPEWENSDTYSMFINSYPQANNLTVLRRQKPEAGLCFMHAPVVLQHYLVSIYKYKHNEPNNMEMIDVTKNIATVWKGNRLLQYLLYDNGGSSIEFF